MLRGGSVGRGDRAGRYVAGGKGGTLGFRGGGADTARPWCTGMCTGCAGFAAFSAVIDKIMVRVNRGGRGAGKGGATDLPIRRITDGSEEGGGRR